AYMTFISSSSTQSVYLPAPISLLRKSIRAWRTSCLSSSLRYKGYFPIAFPFSEGAGVFPARVLPHLCGQYPSLHVAAEALTDFNHLFCPGIGFRAVIDLNPLHKKIKIFSSQLLYSHILRHQFRPPDSVLLIVLNLLHGGF